MTMPFLITSCRHRVFGQQVRVQLAENHVLRLTQAEASSLSFALIAVRDGISSEREIYMSPIGSDAAFSGTVLQNGMRIATVDGALELDWLQVGLLSRTLAEAIG